MPASIAAMKGSCAMDYSGLGVDVVERGLELGERTFDGKADGSFHFLGHLGSQLVGFGAAEHAAFDQRRTKARHRVATQRRLVLLALAEYRDRLVLRVVQWHAGRCDGVAVRR